MSTPVTLTVKIDGENVEAEVSERELRRAGFVYEDDYDHDDCHNDCHADDDCPVPDIEPARNVIALIQAWHNDRHNYGFGLCDDQLCRSVREEATTWLR